VPDVTKLPNYHPEPQWDRVLAPGTGPAVEPGGWAYWTRFDITEADLMRDMADYGLAHHLTSGDIVGFVKNTLSNNGFSLPTEERRRLNIRGSTMSADTDQYTGGASYFFTRIFDKPKWSSHQLVFDPRLLLRTDLISYDGDKFGQSDPAYKKNRAVDINGWRSYSHNGSNEALIKNGFSWLDYVLRLKAGSSAARATILDELRRAGITTLNGRKIENVVVV
jgi:hypothetical protein